ncbi:TolB family protein [Hyphomonas johnsonii]|uniref:Lipoprotein n=1 Tax=Hyphomonas johnsonii MHS-2 TaxID=1280950 RepID=A0A059FV25_9PROT|nr:PD40 domain-containing protein [Hyphomonas johnsonii]KCZ94313.1 hypothetical protein HJO_03025 [Hyphomonas johnsonii MHS-2]
MKRLRSLCLAAVAGTAMLAACDKATPAEPVAVLPDAPAPTTFTRAFGLTENAAGDVRVFAQEDGDLTHLYEMRRSGEKWSTPRQLDFPARAYLTTPSFSFADSYLYYGSDAELPERPGRKDINLWRVPLVDGTWGVPEVLPLETINTAANESSPAVSADGTLYFATNHSRAGGGGYDIMRATPDGNGDWVVRQMPEGTNDPRVDAHLAVTPDGSRLFFYSHRRPTLGSVDIWTMEADGVGGWKTPVNLGAPVNTAGVDFGAGLSGDGKTLFFSRDGRLMEIPLGVALAGAGPVAKDSSN